MSIELQEFESYEHFKNIIPRNPHDWEGSVVLYSALSGRFFNVAFGAGDNLDYNDLDEGFDDYIMVEQYVLTGSMEDVVRQAKESGYVDSCTKGLADVDGGQLLLRRREWTNGDIRRFIMEALEFAGYGLPQPLAEHRKGEWYKDVIYIGADYDRCGACDNDKEDVCNG